MMHLGQAAGTAAALAAELDVPAAAGTSVPLRAARAHQHVQLNFHPLTAELQQHLADDSPDSPQS